MPFVPIVHRVSRQQRKLSENVQVAEKKVTELITSSARKQKSARLPLKQIRKVVTTKNLNSGHTFTGDKPDVCLGFDTVDSVVVDHKGGDAIRSVFTILDRKSKIEPDDPEGIKAKKTIKGLVKLKNVFFSYPARPDQMIFRGLSIMIDAGKMMAALVGPSGSGKSTIIGLVERFYNPLKGSVEIDGQNIKSYNLRLLRSHIALVSQEPTLFAGTIRENITYGQDNVTS